MGLSYYNGFPGKMREASLRRVHKLWESGAVPRPEECIACGQRSGAIHGHSEDYSNDHIHIAICITCHLCLHMRWQQPVLWEAYKQAIREGWRGVPLEQRNALYEIKRLYPPTRPDEWPMELLNEPRSGTVLDMLSPVRFIHPNAPHTAENTAPDQRCPLDHISCPWTLDEVPEKHTTVDERPVPPAQTGHNPFARP